MIRVKWFYRKQDVIQLAQKTLGIANDDLQYIGDNEVFATQHFDKVFADSIQSKCLVYGIAEYDELSLTDSSTTFFTRAQFDHQKFTLKPGFQEWERYCIC